MKTMRLVATFVLAAALAAGAVSAFVLVDPPMKWASTPRNIAINQNGHANVDSPDGDGGVSEIVDAIRDSWNAAGAGNLTTTTVVSNPPTTTGDGISTMHFNVIGTGCSGGCLAITRTVIPPASPTDTVNGTEFRRMTDSDIYFNPSTKFYSSLEPGGCKREYHIETTAVHEVGHLLGLGHTPDASANMYAYADFCDVVPLNQDDIDGINCIYNNGYGCGGCVEDTLIVDRTDCSQPTSGPNAGDFLVETYIVDNCGNAVGGADVTIDIPTSPTGPLSCNGTTDSGGRLGCALANPDDGLYESLVGAVAKAGFNNWNASECGGVGQPPCGCSIEIGGGTGCTPTSSKEKGPRCSNGLDDDCDGLIDGADPDC